MNNNLARTIDQIEDAIAGRLLSDIASGLAPDPRHAHSLAAGTVERLGDAEHLDKGDFWNGDESLGQRHRLEVLDGLLWLTRGNGQREDILLAAGQSYETQPGDHLLAEAMEDSRVRIATLAE